MANVTLTDDIPNGTNFIKLVAASEIETVGLFGTTGFINFDTDQASEADESDLTIKLTGNNLTTVPFPQGTITAMEVESLDTGDAWGSITGLPDLSVVDFLLLVNDPGTTLDDLGNFFFGDADTMTGAGANDVLGGFDGDDQLAGEGGRDRLSGDGGDDVIAGGTGRDRLAGGSGSDQFWFNVTTGNRNADRISDFGRGADTMVLDSTIFTKIGAMLDAAEFDIGASASSADTRIIYDDSTGNLYFDRDGTGAFNQRLFAVVDAGTTLSEADFTMLV